jgi:hypothetical protein
VSGLFCATRESARAQETNVRRVTRAEHGDKLPDKRVEESIVGHHRQPQRVRFRRQPVGELCACACVSCVCVCVCLSVRAVYIYIYVCVCVRARDNCPARQPFSQPRLSAEPSNARLHALQHGCHDERKIGGPGSNACLARERRVRA